MNSIVKAHVVSKFPQNWKMSRPTLQMINLGIHLDVFSPRLCAGIQHWDESLTVSFSTHTIKV